MKYNFSKNGIVSNPLFRRIFLFVVVVVVLQIHKKAIVICPVHKVSRDLNFALISESSPDTSKIPFIVVTS